MCKAIEVSISAKKYAGHLVVMYDFQGIGCSCSSKKEIKTNKLLNDKTYVLQSSEQLKINVASVFKGSRNISDSVKGRNLVTGLPGEIEISTEEIGEALLESSGAIVASVKAVLERTPPELSSDIIEEGILMTGGGALLDGLDKLIESETGVNVRIAEDSVECVVKGTGKVLSYFDYISDDEKNGDYINIK